jgi:hypothetical protein
MLCCLGDENGVVDPYCTMLGLLAEAAQLLCVCRDAVTLCYKLQGGSCRRLALSKKIEHCQHEGIAWGARVVLAEMSISEASHETVNAKTLLLLCCKSQGM